MKYKIGDKVKIKTDKVLEKYKKYDKVYSIVEVRETSDGTYIYKLNRVPNWGAEEMIELVEDYISNE